MMPVTVSAVPQRAANMETPAGPSSDKLQAIRPIADANRSWQEFLAAIAFSFLDQD
jgi:hypothetical protein